MAIRRRVWGSDGVCLGWWRFRPRALSGALVVVGRGGVLVSVRRKGTRAVKTAQHRPAVRRRRFKHDTLVAVDLFSGFGGLTQGIEAAGFDTICAANHSEYAILTALVAAYWGLRKVVR